MFSTTTATRPRMGNRAISDMNPLMTPSRNESTKDLGRGTQATSGGVKVTSGGRTALGGVAPLSPFLPLPAAPSAEELKRQCSQDAEENVVSDAYGRRKINSASQDGPKPKKSRAPTNAAHMIRSYSMPVATQVDYDAERQSLLQRLPFQPSFSANSTWRNGWPSPAAQPTSSANTMTSSVSSMGAKDQPRRPSLQKATTKISPRLQPRSPLSIITVNVDPSQCDQSVDECASADADLGSGSDDTDIVTPRAISPRDNYFGGQTLKELDLPMFDDFQDYVHPDHLRPPPAFSL